MAAPDGARGFPLFLFVNGKCVGRNKLPCPLPHNHRCEWWTFRLVFPVLQPFCPSPAWPKCRQAFGGGWGAGWDLRCLDFPQVLWVPGTDVNTMHLEESVLQDDLMMRQCFYPPLDCLRSWSTWVNTRPRTHSCAQLRWGSWTCLALNRLLYGCCSMGVRPESEPLCWQNGAEAWTSALPCVCALSCVWLWNPIDCVAFQTPLSKGLLRQEYWKVKVKAFVAQLFQLFETPWTVACQVALSMGFSGQEHWSGLPFPSLGIFPTQGWTWISCIAGRFFTIWATQEAQEHWSGCHSLLQGIFPTQGIECGSPAVPPLAGRFFITEPPGKPSAL